MSQPLIGRHLARKYRVDEHLGSGAMGDVYRGWHERLRKAVAIKVISARHLAREHARSDFENEAHKLAQISHGNVASVSDFDRDGDLDFLVMEYVSGVTMNERAMAGPLAESDVIDLGIQLASGLIAAHERGIVHSDLKPANVRVTEAGTLKILDFGIARFVRDKRDPDATRTQDPGKVRGSFAYMAPEQMLGAEADARSDIYSAGVLLFEIATGQRPFPDLAIDLLAYKVPNVPPPRPRDLNRAISPAMEAILLKCLEKNPQDRFASAKELRVALDRVVYSGAVPDPESRPTRPRWWKTRAAKMSVAAVTLVLIAVAVRKWPWPPPVKPGATHLAVLPFKNLSGQPEREYLSDGMADELSTRLGRINYGRLRVVGFPATERYKGERIDLADVRRTLGVAYVLDGSVTSDASTLVINARLSDTQSGFQRWTGQYRGRLAESIDIQHRIADSIATALSIEFSEQPPPAGLARRPSEAGYDQYLRGRFSVNQRTYGALEKARESFESATKSDPDQAPFHAELARAYVLLENLGYWPAEEAMPRAAESARRALVLDPDLALGRVTLAAVRQDYDRNWAEAESEFQAAISLDPSLAAGREGYATLLLLTGRRDSALEQLNSALELDPLSLAIHLDLATCFYLLGDDARALQEYDTTLALHPEAPIVHYQRGLLLLKLSRETEAMESIARAMSLEDARDADIAAMRESFHDSGTRGYWRWKLSVLQDAAEVSHVPAYQFARAEAALGNLDHAFQFLDYAIDHRESAALGVVLDPVFESMRDDARFAAVRAQLELPIVPSASPDGSTS